MKHFVIFGIALPLMAVACSRSTLNDGPLSGGFGGAAGGGSASSSSSITTTVSSGAGGFTPIHCDGLEQQAIRSFDDPTAAFEDTGHAGQLLASMADAQQATLLVRMDPGPFVADLPSELAHTTFLPWGEWPAQPLPPVVRLSIAHVFATPRRAEDGLSLLGSYATFGGQGMHYHLNLSTSAPPNPLPVPASNEAHEPAFVTAGDGTGRHGIGWISHGVGERRAHIGIATAAGTSDDTIACTTADMHLHGIRVAGGQLVAVTQSMTANCGAVQAIEVRYIQDDGVVTVTHTQPSTPLTQLQLVPRNDGAWLLWQQDDGLTSSALLALPLDAVGTPTGEALTLFDDGVIFERVAAAEFGEGSLAIAYADTFDPGPPNIILQLFDPSGAKAAATSFSPAAWPTIYEGFSLLSSPAADAVLLSWSSSMADDEIDGNTLSFVTRFDCVP